MSNILWVAQNPLHDDMVRTHQDVFDSVFIVATKHEPNEIVLAMPAKTPLVRADLVRRASQLSKDQKLRFDVGSYVRSSFREPAAKALTARILLDKDKMAPSK